MLRNPRRERFGQELAKGKTQIEAYKLAGYKPNRGDAAVLANNPEIVDRVKQILANSARRAEISVASITKMFMEDHKLAVELGQASAAVSAAQAIAKLHGLMVDRNEVQQLTASVDLSRLNRDQLTALAELLALAEGDKPAGERDS